MEAIAIIIRQTDEAVCQNLLNSLSTLNIPTGYEVEVKVIPNAVSKAAAYNAAMRESSAKYKIYIDETATVLNKNLLGDVVKLFEYDSRIGVLGLYGSEMPITGDFTKAKKRYGILGYREEADHIKAIHADNPLWWQKVHLVDGLFMATAVDTDWDENVAEEFLAAAKCLEIRKNNYLAAVPMQDYPWCMFDKISAYNQNLRENDLKSFAAKYQNEIQPLVSILIPTYNQPVFFKQALDSALAQDYKNIEIIVGDDSTNEDTKSLMADYVKKYPQIKYYYHGGPLGNKGDNNADFILNKAQGDFINYLYHDDLFYPNKISSMMTGLVADLNEEIGMVASARDFINEQGEKIGGNPLCMWQPTKDTVLTASEIARKILALSMNYIGEMTTVLLRKSMLRQADSRYCSGCFAGIRDKANGDVATFLEVARRGKNCLFLKDTLSAFRKHSGQNTSDVSIVINSIIEWLNYIVISYKTKNFITSETELAACCQIWYTVNGRHLNRIKKLIMVAVRLVVAERNLNSIKKEFYLKNVIRLIKNKNYKAVINLGSEYINNNYGKIIDERM